MNLPRFEVASGDIDGVNTVFTVTTGYVPLTTAVFLNGQLKRGDYADGWAETNPATGVVTLFEAPIDGDVVHVFFLDGSVGPPSTSEVVCPIAGAIVEVDEVFAGSVAVGELGGVLDETDPMEASVLDAGAILGLLDDTEPLSGVLVGIVEEC